MAPEAKLFAEYFLLPFVYTVDVRKGVGGGHDGIRLLRRQPLPPRP